jgi:3-deoxy-7-phosphoheptulonate synthase
MRLEKDPLTTFKTNSSQTPSPIAIGPVTFNSQTFALIVGPCSIESQDQIDQITHLLKESGLNLMRGGIWKLRTSPESFQGLGVDALNLIQDLRTKHNLHLISEITDPRQIEFLTPLISAFQVGARNMYNYALLKELGKLKTPVILKRSFSATVEEWLKASDYILNAGNDQVILCERGIRTFETSSRYTFDLNGALIAKSKTHLPVIVDPSHGVGLREFVPPLIFAAAAAGLDGALVEIHPNPEKALSDGRQSMELNEFKNLLPKLDSILEVVGRKRS